MRFTLTPAVRQLALIFPVLLIALPVAMSAGEDKFGPVLPPPSLYDVIPPTQPSVPVQATRTPAGPVQSAPPLAASKTAEPVKPAPLPVASKAVPASAAAKTERVPTEPWYRRWFGWMKPKPKAAPAQAPVAMAALDTNGRGQYAYDSPNRTIRTGMTGQCIKTGAWDTGAATADCDPALVAKKPAPVRVASASMPAGSAPAPQAPSKPEPVEIVPLPPALPVARDEHALQPEAELVPVKDEMITALAETHLMPEPDFDKLTLSAGALFPLSSATIKPSGHEKLDEFVEHLRGMEFETVKIVGHTDPTGSKASNASLSKHRAEAVKRYLVSKGVDAKRIVTAGKGGAEPMPKTENCDALPRMEKIICYSPDRRVEIEVVGSTPRG